MDGFEFDDLPPLELVPPSEPLAVPEPEHEVQPGELPADIVRVADIARVAGEGKSLPDQAFPPVRAVVHQHGIGDVGHRGVEVERES